MPGQPLPPPLTRQGQSKSPKTSSQQAPSVPRQPQAGKSPNLPPNASKRKSNKSLVFGLIGGVIVLVLATVAIFFLRGPSEKDYREAIENLSEIKSAYNEISSSQNDLINSTSGDKRKAAAEKMKENVQKINDEFDKLGKMRAIQKDEGAQEKWLGLQKKREEADKAIAYQLEIYEKILPLYEKVRNTTSSSTDDEVKKLIKELKSVSIDDDEAKNFVEASIVYARACRSYLQDSQGLQFFRFYSARSKYTKEISRFFEVVNNRAKKMQINSEIDDLESILAEKINEN